MTTLLTGFGPFGKCAENPSQLLAERCGLPYKVVPVTYGAADAFIQELAMNPPEQLLMMGLSGSAERFNLELVAHNRIGTTPDIDGVVAGPGPIDPAAPAHLGTTLWRHPQFFADYSEWETSLDPGGYLCNYLYFRALQWLPIVQTGFLHVPSLEKMSLQFQLTILEGLLEYLVDQEAAAV